MSCGFFFFGWYFGTNVSITVYAAIYFNENKCASFKSLYAFQEYYSLYFINRNKFRIEIFSMIICDVLSWQHVWYDNICMRLHYKQTNYIRVLK